MKTVRKSGVLAATVALMLLCPIGSSAVVLADSCLHPGSQAATQIDIVINSVTNLPEFENTIDCVGGSGNTSQPGNVCLDIGKRPDLKFHLKGPGANDWEFVDFQLSGNGNDWPGTLPLGVYSDFQFDSDNGLQTGRPYVTINGNNMSVQNNNCHEFDVYYRITLKKDGVPPIWYRIHPLIQNRGTN